MPQEIRVIVKNREFGGQGTKHPLVYNYEFITQFPQNVKVIADLEIRIRRDFTWRKYITGKNGDLQRRREQIVTKTHYIIVTCYYDDAAKGRQHWREAVARRLTESLTVLKVLSSRTRCVSETT